MSDLVPRETDSWTEVLPAVGDLATKIATTNFVPKGLRGKPAEIAACVLTGREIGIGPMQALQKIHVIEGRPSMSAELMRSLVMAAGHQITYPVYSNDKVTARGQRGGTNEATEVTWTLKDAERIGVASRDTWRKYPRQMLSARATSELCRLLFPDALGGISYASEELTDDEQAPAQTPVKRSKARKAEPAPSVPEPALTPEKPAQDDLGALEADPTPADAEIVDAEVIEETEPVLLAQKMTGDEITGPQTKMLGSLMGTLGMDRDAALAFCADHIGRQIETRNDLTKAEATKIIDALVALQGLQGGDDD
jgi:hypothetical protein